MKSRRFRLLLQAMRPYRRAIAWGLACLCFVDLLEVIPPLLLRSTTDLVVQNQPQAHSLAQLALAYLLVCLLQSVGRFGWRYFLIRSSHFAGRDLRDRFAGFLYGLPRSFFDRRKVGDLMALPTSDIEAVRMALGPGLLTMADAVIYMLTIPVAMFLLSPTLTLLAFIPLPFISWIVIRSERAIDERYRAVQDSLETLSAQVEEGFSGIRVVKSFAKEAAQTRRIESTVQEFQRLSLRLERIQVSFGPSLDFMMSLGIVILLYVGGHRLIAGSTALTLGTFVAFQRYIQYLIWPMTAVGLAITYQQRGLTSAGRLLEFWDESPDAPGPPGGPTGGKPGGAEAGRIEVRQLTFRYPGSSTPALENVSLTIDTGSRAAFVGRVGSGKTTLLQLLAKLYPVDRGMIQIGGVDINDWDTAALRAEIGFVPQEAFLFAGSIAENLDPQNAAPPNGLNASLKISLKTALQKAQMYAEVERLPQAVQTLLGERGVNLSGGQRQRLTIARALMLEPRLLILDDALSSVDTQTEQRILDALESDRGSRTELIAAHRVSSVRTADQVFVLEHGRLVESGRPSELASKTDGHYARMIQEQRAKRELDHYLEQVP